MHSAADELIARLRRNPDDYAAFVALRAHYHQQGDWASLVNLLEGWATRARDPRAAAQAFYEAADLALGALGDQPRGVSLYERTIERSPGHAEAYMRLEALAEETGDTRRLAELLEPWPGHRGRVQRLVEMTGISRPAHGPRYSPLDFRGR